MSFLIDTLLAAKVVALVVQGSELVGVTPELLPNATTFAANTGEFPSLNTIRKCILAGNVVSG